MHHGQYCQHQHKREPKSSCLAGASHESLIGGDAVRTLYQTLQILQLLELNRNLYVPKQGGQQKRASGGVRCTRERPVSDRPTDDPCGLRPGCRRLGILRAALISPSALSRLNTGSQFAAREVICHCRRTHRQLCHLHSGTAERVLQ